MLPGNQSHDYHHSTAPENLGAFGCLDHLLGTNWGFLRTWQASVNKSYSTPDYPVDKILKTSEISKADEALACAL
jgi:sterol desaturase/sphingolipid hydroxylase (fatty acid hydroxylase superfamily)